MTHPTEMERPAVDTLRDQDVADWLERRDPAAIYFWDESDAPCQRHRPRMEVVAASANVPMGIIDVRRDALVAQALGVKSVPALVVFRAGEVIERVLGAAPEHILREALGADGPHRPQ